MLVREVVGEGVTGKGRICCGDLRRLWKGDKSLEGEGAQQENKGCTC